MTLAPRRGVGKMPLPPNSSRSVVFVVRMSAIGDVVMTTRALADLRARGAEPVLVTAPSLADVARCMLPARAFVTIEGNALRTFEKHADTDRHSDASLSDIIAGAKVSFLDLHCTARSRRALATLRLACLNAGAFPGPTTSVSKRAALRVFLVLWAWIRSAVLGQKSRARTPDYARSPKPRRDIHALQARAVAKHALRLGPAVLKSPSVNEDAGGRLFTTNALFFGRTLTACGKPLEPRGYVCLVPGASGFSKQWPKEHFRALSMALLSDSTGSLIILGGKEEQAVGRYLASAPELLGFDVRDTTGTLSLAETFRLIESASHVFTNDTFASHVADLTGTPATIFYGATSPEFGFAPRSAFISVLSQSLTCSPCTRHGTSPCRYGNVLCLRSITPEVAHATIRKN